MLNPKIADHHLMRKACIYIRQSTMAQVRFNQESTERQYNLADQAKSLGWMPEQIRILDGDLAQSGELTTKRDDFKTLVSDVAMGQVGAIFSLESSRLARRHAIILTAMGSASSAELDAAASNEGADNDFRNWRLCDMPTSS
jgi:DNA invertase Pin-like site-specific DNA recombinase